MDDESSSEDETMDDAGSKGDEMIVEVCSLFRSPTLLQC